ncbi:MAG: LPS export ABC transporter ATP-binding protein [Bacteroidota bacterium]|nr:LPS export ABC transporter ATP-binding protein [Bacteroidota bacterium]
MNEPQILRAEGLTKRFRRRTVVRDVSIHVERGEIVGLLGPNGAGKSTSFHMIVGLERPNAGRIYLGEEDITAVPMYQRARKGLGYLAQESSVFQQLTVEQNLLAVLEFQKVSRTDRLERVNQLIRQFGLEKVRKAKAFTLSGGERRRTEIARSMALQPLFFLLDEPFAGVDPITVEYIQDIVRRLRDYDIGVLITDHNVHETLAITDRAYLLFDGCIMNAGTAEELAADPDVRKRYLGEKFSLDRYG